MIERHKLPAIVYGPGPAGFGIMSASSGFLERARLAFLGFAKSISWRPAKMEAADMACVALVPSPDGVVACRLTECGTDVYGRRLAMRIEGVLCGHDDCVWGRFTALDAWPNEPIGESCEVSVHAETNGGSAAKVEWTPASGHPLILASRKLVNAPAQWFAG